jgi:hypothetical protein
MIKNGSCWAASNGNVYQVIESVELEGHTWVHYRTFSKDEEEVKEYSCYEESFLSRFHQLPECPKK